LQFGERERIVQRRKRRSREALGNVRQNGRPSECRGVSICGTPPLGVDFQVAGRLLLLAAEIDPFQCIRGARILQAMWEASAQEPGAIIEGEYLNQPG
jgi:hypothetical protein